MGGGMRALSLWIVLFLFWLALSGHYTPFLISLGAVAAAFCVFVALRMGAVDEEGHPIHLLANGALTYFVWLTWEIIKSAWRVTTLILNPKLPISPTMTRIRTGQRTPVGVNIYANSITLTPGTITVGVKAGLRDGTMHPGDSLIVHALEQSGAGDLEAGGMDKRVSRFEGP